MSVIAWILCYRAKLRAAVKQCKVSECSLLPKKMKIDPITFEELRSAEREVIRQVQRESFKEELAALERACPAVFSSEQKTKREDKKTSKIVKRDPQVTNGLLHGGGRIANRPFQQDMKHPIILPKCHHIIPLIIRYYYLVSGHVEHVLSLLRDKFWIIGARAAVRKSLRDCLDCKRRQAFLANRRWPTYHGKPPFTYVAVDCFGPFPVWRGRSKVKRYGMLFTYLVVRGGHIKVAQSLNTNSFLTLH